jgi:transcriptional antiterminator RfaH
MQAWYAAYTKTRMEIWARSNLWERGFEVYLPLFQKQRRHARKVDWVSAPLFPRYLFVRADLEMGERRSVTSAPGVEHLVAFGLRPAPIADAVIEEIREREDRDGYVQLCDPGELTPGDTVRLESGSLCHAVGLFQRMAEKDRIVVLMQIMGRSVNVKVPASSVSAVL